MFSCPLSHEGSAVPASLASQCCLLKQPSNLPWNPRASFPVTRDSKKRHPFPILIMAERVSFLVSDSPKHVQVFLLELANFQAELPIKISLNFNTFSLALELWKQLQAASFPGSPFQEGCKFVFPGTTIPTRQFIFPQTRNQGSLGLLPSFERLPPPICPPAANWEQEGNVVGGKASISAQLLPHHSSMHSQGRASEVRA